MSPFESSPEVEATVEFERALADLVLSAYARGGRIERAWEITTPVADAPNWLVEIKKLYSEGEPSPESEVIEE